MSPENTTRDEREDIEMLLPWYAAGTLEADETARVAAYLKEHPEIENQIALAREEMDETIRLNEALGSPSAGAIDRLMAQVERESPGALARSGAAGGLFEGIARFFGTMSPRAVAMGAVLAIAIICVQAITLGVMVNRGGGTFHVATGDGDTKVVGGTSALVSFAEGATMEEVGAFLTTYGARIVDGPKGGGIYTIRLTDKVLPGGERDALLKRLRADPLVRFAGPAT